MTVWSVLYGYTGRVHISYRYLRCTTTLQDWQKDGRTLHRLVISEILSDRDWSLVVLQASAVPAVGAHLREVRAGDLHSSRAANRRWRRLLVGIVQRGHTRLRQPGSQSHSDNSNTDYKQSETANLRQGRRARLTFSSFHVPQCKNSRKIPRSVSWSGSLPKSNRLSLVTHLTLPKKIVKIRRQLFWVILLTDRQTDKQTNTQRQKRNLLGGDNNYKPAW